MTLTPEQEVALATERAAHDSTLALWNEAEHEIVRLRAALSAERARAALLASGLAELVDAVSTKHGERQDAERFLDARANAQQVLADETGALAELLALREVAENVNAFLNKMTLSQLARRALPEWYKARSKLSDNLDGLRAIRAAAQTEGE